MYINDCQVYHSLLPAFCFISNSDNHIHFNNDTELTDFIFIFVPPADPRFL